MSLLLLFQGGEGQPSFCWSCQIDSIPQTAWSRCDSAYDFKNTWAQWGTYVWNNIGTT